MGEKHDFVLAYMWIYGETKKAALSAYKNRKDDPEYIRLVISAYMGNASRSFYDD